MQTREEWAESTDSKGYEYYIENVLLDDYLDDEESTQWPLFLAWDQTPEADAAYEKYYQKCMEDYDPYEDALDAEGDRLYERWKQEGIL